jgi:hypothetical protein
LHVPNASVLGALTLHQDPIVAFPDVRPEDSPPFELESASQITRRLSDDRARRPEYSRNLLPSELESLRALGFTVKVASVGENELLWRAPQFGNQPEMTAAREKPDGNSPRRHFANLGISFS